MKSHERLQKAFPYCVEIKLKQSDHVKDIFTSVFLQEEAAKKFFDIVEKLAQQFVLQSRDL